MFQNTKYILVLLTLFYGTLSAQTVSIRVNDASGSGLPGAAVQIIHAADSLSTFGITDVNGYVYFDNAADGLHFIKINFIGYQPFVTYFFITKEIRQFEFVLVANAITLEGITITAKKPLIRQEDDKMIIDPEPLAGLSTNTLEILENTPGLYVDQDGGIFISAASPAAVYVNGRELKMSTQEISTILKSLPPGSVEKIEIIRTPSAKYDASASGGIINIVLKKGVKIGRFGSVSAGMNQGRYGNRFAGFSYNNSSDKSAIYINGNYNINDRLDEINSVRLLKDESTVVQTSDNRNKQHSPMLGFGITFDPGKKTSFSYDGRINVNFRNSDAKNLNIVQDKEHHLLSESTNITESESFFFNMQQDFGCKVKLDTTGSEIDNKISYTFIQNAQDQNISTHFILPIDSTILVLGDNFHKRHFLVLQSDVLKILPWHLKLETGIKASWQFFESSAAYNLNLGGIMIADTIRSNNYDYDENITSMYAQLSRPLLADFQLKVGLRCEYGRMDGRQFSPVDTGFVVSRTDFFPYIYLSRKVFEMMGVKLFGYLIYRKTISRPGYQELNPSVRFIDQYLLETGNPSLTPQFTDNYEMNISYNDMPVFAVGKSITRDAFSMVMYADESNPDLLLRTYDNVGSNTELYFRAMAGIPPGGRYFFAIGCQYSKNTYNGLYENAPYTFSRDSWRFFTFHSLTLFKETKLTVSGFMMENGMWNFYELEDFGRLNIGMTRTFYNKQLSVSVYARDILGTDFNKFTFKLGSVNSTGERYTDQRRIGFSIRYNFGIKKKEEQKGLNGFDEDVQ